MLVDESMEICTCGDRAHKHLMEVARIPGLVGTNDETSVRQRTVCRAKGCKCVRFTRKI